ncbi:hypothetical protein PRUPE_3G291500 [Prunus persica]|uniref:Cyclin-dependent protein kinase inhibitor SMR6 n=4 Tax=Prunus TaxID=3754 RepID=A0A6J5UJD3_PRUAR|nr:cyclin-dependent protein kinase inhibitor SMR6 [Prunus persica]XP_008230541.1 PREDICTED: uncharacterized protein LOC103329803 [Prunus mume]XP_034209968.1 cyclin-dependent protein kinase inhibitor SMR6 [Prunus dulcis]KAH0984689.1 hypothetical protein GBA52_011866 [Prunus armeniaca]KAH0984892.1 hypothetical protein GBA52_012069 [Prunus armeniaca]KAI5341231.1 hypothetical protein L3X38_020505 [Prunus dulcis]ONI19680.1 hypothetical protein PRUPE_3G291500 [Prunus persica]CAB4275305.1 unnamed p
MGFSKKSQVDGGLESEGKKWVIAGISVRTSLKPINTKLRAKESEAGEEEEASSTTPTAKEARIPEIFSCPPAPRKSRPPSRCNFNGVREFFTPPDLDSVFKLHVEKAN